MTTVEKDLIHILTAAINDAVSMCNTDNTGMCKAGTIGLPSKHYTGIDLDTSIIPYSFYYDCNTDIVVCKKALDNEAVTHRFKNTHKAEGLIIYND